MPEAAVTGVLPPTPRRLLDVREVAVALHCGRTLVYELIAAGELPVIKLGKLTRIPSAALDELVSRRLQLEGHPQPGSAGARVTGHE
jgi:excisionase family DNA binding protein